MAGIDQRPISYRSASNSVNVSTDLSCDMHRHNDSCLVCGRRNVKNTQHGHALEQVHSDVSSVSFH